MITFLCLRRRGAAAAALTVALAASAALLSPATATAAGPGAARAAGQTVTLPVRDALAQLPVTAEDRTGYQRTAFKHWVDADKDGCDTRKEVLKAEAIVAPVQGPGCVLTGGEWYSPYDDTYFTDARALDIDHLVPLAEAWDSGASAWTAKEREAYANDLGDARDLIAVSAKSNRSKADQDPSTWLPPAAGYRCTYVTDWIADKIRWGLSVDAGEQAALEQDLAACPDAPITVTTAR
ncbi:HNH endonuclease family protein [Streptomyces sp. NRRL F-5123]|uniref:HNH endonuclease family protein n=1 Tax=Streptomyces sp. NRRL F-5123 TaxID=1463856 RepID=UPI00099B8CD7|nr:HNH endonuclease family protein [Streptomyces sp. NRRL F-5123]